MKEKKKGVVMRQEQIAIEKPEQISALFGSFDGNVKILEQELGVTILSRDSGVRISGDDVAVEKALSVVRSLLALSAKGEGCTSGTGSTGNICRSSLHSSYRCQRASSQRSNSSHQARSDLSSCHQG